MDDKVRRPVEYSEDNLTRNKLKDEHFYQSLSSVARNAVNIVEAIRTDEINNYWRHAGLVGQEDDERFAGEMFSKAKPFILGSELWKVIQRMPKGALLHTHWNSMLSYDTILRILQKTEGIVVSSSQSLYLDLYRKNATLSISHANYTLNESVPSLHSEKYIAGTKVSLLRAAKECGRAAMTHFFIISRQRLNSLKIYPTVMISVSMICGVSSANTLPQVEPCYCMSLCFANLFKFCLGIWPTMA